MKTFKSLKKKFSLKAFNRKVDQFEEMLVEKMREGWSAMVNSFKSGFKDSGSSKDKQSKKKGTSSSSSKKVVKGAGVPIKPGKSTASLVKKPIDRKPFKAAPSSFIQTPKTKFPEVKKESKNIKKGVIVGSAKSSKFTSVNSSNSSFSKKDKKGNKNDGVELVKIQAPKPPLTHKNAISKNLKRSKTK